MYDLSAWRPPAGERRRFLATRLIAPQTLCAEIERDLAHLAAGTCAEAQLGVVRGLLRALRGISCVVLAHAVAGRLALLAAVLVSSRIFTEATGLTRALAISAGYLLFQLAGAYFTSASDTTRGQLAQATSLYVTSRINAKLLRLDPQASGELTMGTLKNLVSSDVRYFAEFVSNVAWNLAPAVASVLILGPVVYYLAGLPGLVGIAVSFGNVPLAMVLSRRMQRAQAGQQIYLDRVATIVGEWLRNVRLVRFLGWQDAFEREIAANVRHFVRALSRRHVIACLTFGISFAWWMVPVVAMLWTSKLMGRKLDLVGFFSALWVIQDMGDYLQHLPHTINLAASASACLERIKRLEAAPELARRFMRSAAPAPGADAVPVAMELRDVAFAYAPAPNATAAEAFQARFSLRFRFDERLAVVGEVGCGKTTLLRLIAGELAPLSGEVLVSFSDGSALPLWDERVYERVRGRLGYVPQEPFISNQTLAANIALAAGDAGAAHMEAAYLAELEADLALLPKGMAEPIGEAGVNLSGGQKQRVNLARAFYAKRPFMLLDDPLSAVDVRTEAALMTHLLAASEGFVLVTHRLGELGRLPRIVELSGGRVVRDGPPGEVRK